MKKLILITLLLILFVNYKFIYGQTVLDQKFDKTTNYCLMKEDDGKTGVYFITNDKVEVYFIEKEDTARTYYKHCLRPNAKKVVRLKGGNGYGVWKGKYVVYYEVK